MIRSYHCILAFSILVPIAAAAHTQAAIPIKTTLATTDARIELLAGATAPMLLRLEDPHRLIWTNQAIEPLPEFVEISGESVPVRWSLKPDSSIVDAHRVVFVYESAKPHLLAQWEWQTRAAFGALEHRITVSNLGSTEIGLPLIDSLHLASRMQNGEQIHNFYVEKGADSPSAHGTHLDAVNNGYRWIGRSSTYAHTEQGEDREIIPIEFVHSDISSHPSWYAGIEFSGRTRIALSRHGHALDTKLGLNDDLGSFRTLLQPGQTFEAPVIFLGAFHGGLDEAANQLRPWVRAVLNNPATWADPHYPLTVSNSWGSGMHVDESLALRMISDAHELGLEMFHLDAGWFRGVGDWYPDPVKFPHGLAYIADEAHRQGLRFGIWVDWSQAGDDHSPGALNASDPKVKDWLVSDLPAGWKPEEFKGQTIDLGVPAAQAWAQSELRRIVRDYHLDMLEHDGYLVAQGCTRTDHPHAPPNPQSLSITQDSGFRFVRSSNSTDVSYHAVQAYYSLYEQLRRQHPGLLLEICNDGGRMVDFGSAAHGDYFSITDTYDPLSNRRAFYDTSFTLPPAMLESYIESWPAPRINSFLYMLRSGMMGWMSLMLDTTKWTPQERAAASRAIALYKEQLRPLIRDAKLYHVSNRPDGVHWDGIEYWDGARKKGVLFAFRGAIVNESEHTFRLAGLNSAATYRLHFEDASSPDRVVTGSKLMRSGLHVLLPESLSSELVFLEQQ